MRIFNFDYLKLTTRSNFISKITTVVENRSIFCVYRQKQKHVIINSIHPLPFSESKMFVNLVLILQLIILIKLKEKM